VIYFETGKDTISKASFPTLKLVAEIMKGNPQVEFFKVEGHADALESRKAAQQLSLRRANKVVLFLIHEGIPTSRLIPVGRGSEHPADTNDTTEGRAKNRRVEFVVVNDRNAS
jgi:OOP family OmpA-OmpF porin